MTYGGAVDASDGAPIAPPTDAEVAALLEFTRAVAHASERRAAPLAAYAVGLAWGSRSPEERVRLLRASTAAVDAANPETAGQTGR